MTAMWCSFNDTLDSFPKLVKVCLSFVQLAILCLFSVSAKSIKGGRRRINQSSSSYYQKDEIYKGLFVEIYWGQGKIFCHGFKNFSWVHFDKMKKLFPTAGEQIGYCLPYTFNLPFWTSNKALGRVLWRFLGLYLQTQCWTITTWLKWVSISQKLFPNSQPVNNFSLMNIRENGSIFTPAL